MRKVLLTLIIMVLSLAIMVHAEENRLTEIIISSGETYHIIADEDTLIWLKPTIGFVSFTMDLGDLEIHNVKEEFMFLSQGEELFIAVTDGKCHLQTSDGYPEPYFIKASDKLLTWKTINPGDTFKVTNKEDLPLDAMLLSLEAPMAFNSFYSFEEDHGVVTKNPLTTFETEMSGTRTLIEKNSYFSYQVLSGKAVLFVLNPNEQGKYAVEDYIHPPSSWAKSSIESMRQNNQFDDFIFKNYTENITRKDFAYLMVKIYELFSNEKIVVDSSISFKDTNDINVLKATTMGITKGIGNNLFGPNELITREQMAVMLVNTLRLGYLPFYSYSDYRFVDEKSFSTWARDAIYSAKSEGFINGVGENKYNPSGHATIEMALVITNNVLEKYQGEYWVNSHDFSAIIDVTGVKGAISSSDNIQKVDISTSSYSNNQVHDTYSRHGSIPKSYVYHTDENIGVVMIEDKIMITILDKNYQLIEKKEIPFELEIFGTFYHGTDSNYFVFGQPNPEEDNNLEVIRIVEYDQSFNKINEFSIRNCYTILPFRSGAVRLEENRDHIILHTSRLRYLTDDGLNHQSQLTIILNKNTRQIENTLGRFQENHVSHSFDQYVLIDGSDYVFLDHGDAYPRSIVLHKGSGSSYEEVDLFQIPGAIGANQTGVSIGGFEMSSTHYLTLFNTVDHTKVKEYTNFEMVGLEQDQRDIIIRSIPRFFLDESQIKETQIAKYIGTDKNASVPKMVKISDDKFIVLWQEFFIKDSNNNSLKYVYVNHQGEKISPVYTNEELILTDCQPILNENQIIWQHEFGGNNYIYKLTLTE